MPLTEDHVRAALQQVKFPGFNRDIVSFGFVKNIAVTGPNDVAVTLQIAARDPAVPPQVQLEATHALRALPGVGQVNVVLADAPPPPPAPAGGMWSGPPQIEGVRHVIAVGSGKGGVGKSTVAVNLAVALSRQGLKVGLLDADIYGPTVPKMLGATTQATITNERLDPVEKFGLKLMSMALLLEPDQAVVWRGPMIMKALEQFCRQVNWGELDALVIDLPPGTGDAQISLAQLVALDGGVIVTTPQDVAMDVVRRGVTMFQKVNVKILGLIENMSHHVCPHCGKPDDVFGHGGAQREATRLGVPLLGEIPLNSQIRICGDNGQPVVLTLPDSPAAEAFRQCAATLWQKVTAR